MTEYEEFLNKHVGSDKFICILLISVYFFPEIT